MAGTYVGKTTEGKTCKLLVQNKTSKGDYGAVYTVGGVTTTYAASKLDRVKYAHYSKKSGGNNNTEDAWAMLTKVQYGTTGRIAFDIDQYKDTAQDKSQPLKRVVEAYNASTNTLSTCYINPQPAPAVVPTPKPASNYNFASCPGYNGTWNLGGSDSRDIRYRNDTHCMTGTYLGKTTDNKMCKLELNGPGMDATFTANGKTLRYKASKLDRVAYTHGNEKSGNNDIREGDDSEYMRTKLRFGDTGRLGISIHSYLRSAKDKTKPLTKVVEAYDAASKTTATCYVDAKAKPVAQSTYDFASCPGYNGTWNLGGSDSRDIRYRNDTHCMTGTYLGKTTDNKMCKLELHGPDKLGAVYEVNGVRSHFAASKLSRVAYQYGEVDSGNNDTRRGKDSTAMLTQMHFGANTSVKVDMKQYLLTAYDTSKPLARQLTVVQGNKTSVCNLK